MDMSSQLQDGELNKERPILVLLMGAPGSGKSTFCEQVMRLSSRSWVRICQDTINNGKAGTKPQCLKSAASALKDGKSVFIDRCNLEREQRSEFVKLGDSNIDVHCVVLDLPAQLCISRCVKRTGHEGNLQGGRAAAVVNKMLQKKELPKLSEGFSRIMFCYSESDVQAAIDTYAALGASGTLPSGSVGQKKPETKVQLGIMKFLKRVDVPSNTASSLGSDKDSSCPEISDKKKDPDCEMPNNVSSVPAAEHKEVKECDNLSKGTVGHDGSLDNIPTLAFPSISTADFKFNNDKASDIIVEKVEEFVKKLGNARLVLVDLSHGSKILSLVKAKAAQKNIDTKKFFTFVGDITQLYSQRGLRCNVIVNAANWRLKPGGGGVNAAIFSAAGSALETATKERAASLLPGHALTVPLPSSSPLYSREGVTHVIHVLGPNMNPGRPNCLNDDYAKGCKILRDAYTALFNGFISTLANQEKLTSGRSENFLSETLLRDTSHSGLKNSVTNGDQKTKRDGDCVSERSKKSKGSQNENAAFEKVLGDNSKINGNASMRWSSWAQALYKISRHPENHKDELLEILDDVVVLNDLYPKAQKHLLVLARCEGLDSLADVHQEHLPLLMTMHAVGLKWTEKFLNEDSSMVFRLGYHSAPSMRQLHLHVISQDFNSNHLKNKKHWNSFNTEFFRDSVDVIEEIRNNGKATLKTEESYLSTELRCLRCRSAHPNIPRLKSHIINCRSPFPPSLLQSGRLVTGGS